MPTVTTCAGYAECYISTYARLWWPVPGMWIVIFLPMPGCDDLCQVCGLLYFYLYASCDDLCRVYRVLCFYLYQLRRMHQVLFFYLCQLCHAVTTCAGYVDCYISTYASCDNLCWVCELLYFYLCQLRRGRQVLFFYLFQQCQALTTCAGYVDCHFSTYASCDDLCQANRQLYIFHLCHLCLAR